MWRRGASPSKLCSAEERLKPLKLARILHVFYKQIRYLRIKGVQEFIAILSTMPIFNPILVHWAFTHDFRSRIYCSTVGGRV
jgi:hypothetical protein